MKVVKLNSRHTLFRDYGFSYALRFNTWSTEATKYESAANRAFGSQWAGRPRWKTHWTKPNGRTRERPYWIGVHSEAMLTQLMLST